VALHFPSSSALRSTLEDLPILASKALYCTNKRPNSSFLSLSSCYLLASSFSSLTFSNLWMFLICSTSLFFTAYSSTLTSSLTCTFSRWVKLWSCKIFTLLTLSAFRSLSSSWHHSVKKAFRALKNSLASFWDCNSWFKSYCFSWKAAWSSTILLSSSWMVLFNSRICLL